MTRNTIIHTVGLYKYYFTQNIEQCVLNEINVEIYKGDFTVIMGQSGSGKSTLLYNISSMDRPTSGTINLLGNDLTKMSEKSIAFLRRKEISFIFQNINLLPDLTSFENIAYPAYQIMGKSEARKRTDELLTEFGLMSEKEKYPSEMSGGQQQRIAIIRALLSEPKVIFADEPTGSLNCASGIHVLDHLTRLYEKGQSIIMVTHDIKASARGNRLLLLADGQIAGDLNLGAYNCTDQSTREEAIFNFLKQNNW
jgi:putative ABC transport system ATP-binding protein